MSYPQASSELQKIEEERIAQMQDLLNKYNSHLSVIGPKMIRVRSFSSRSLHLKAVIEGCHGLFLHKNVV